MIKSAGGGLGRRVVRGVGVTGKERGSGGGWWRWQGMN